MSEYQLQAGYGNGGIESMAQFNKLSGGVTNSLTNLEFTLGMLRQLAETEKQGAKKIATILNQKNKSLRFSVVDQQIQSFWTKQESNRRHFAEALQTVIIDQLDDYIILACEKQTKLQTENSKVQENFSECKKETIKLQRIGLKDWQRLEKQINKNDQYKKTNKRNKIKDLKPLQDKCSKTFNKYELNTLKLNELEQINHKQSCKMGELLHEAQKYAADRLRMHWNFAVSCKKIMGEFINKNKSIVQNKAPPLNDLLWRWLSYPKNHQSATYFPCTSKEVFHKNEIGQQFKKIVQPDYQNSKYIKTPFNKIIKKKIKIPTPAINNNNNNDNWDVNFDNKFDNNDKNAMDDKDDDWNNIFNDKNIEYNNAFIVDDKKTDIADNDDEFDYKEIEFPMFQEKIENIKCNKCDTFEKENKVLKEEFDKIKINEQIFIENSIKTQNKNNALCQENKILKEEFDKVKMNQTKLQKENILLNEECKESKIQFNRLKLDYNQLKKNKTLDSTQYKQWTTNEVIQWIVSLENNRFGLYKQKLEFILSQQNFDGSCIDDVEKSDISDWGIGDFRDKTALHKHIKNLIHQNYKYSINNNKNIEGINETEYI